MNLSNLKPAEGSTHNQNKRLGRGEGSGKGGTAARGHKGAKSRSGYSKKIGFEGGQMPLQRRVPKFGRSPRHRLRPSLRLGPRRPPRHRRLHGRRPDRHPRLPHRLLPRWRPRLQRQPHRHRHIGSPRHPLRRRAPS